MALALAMDAVLVAFSFGLVVKEKRGQAALGLALACGLGQFLMPVLGYVLTGGLVDYVREWDHWIAFVVFSALGGKIIWDSFKEEKEEEETSVTLRTCLLVGVATSIDAFVAGTMIYLTETPLLFAASVIGGLTFVLALTGFFLTRFLRHLPVHWLGLVAGLMLIGIGVKALVAHLFV